MTGSALMATFNREDTIGAVLTREITIRLGKLLNNRQTRVEAQHIRPQSIIDIERTFAEAHQLREGLAGIDDLSADLALAIARKLNAIQEPIVFCVLDLSDGSQERQTRWTERWTSSKVSVRLALEGDNYPGGPWPVDLRLRVSVGYRIEKEIPDASIQRTEGIPRG